MVSSPTKLNTVGLANAAPLTPRSAKRAIAMVRFMVSSPLKSHKKAGGCFDDSPATLRVAGSAICRVGRACTLGITSGNPDWMFDRVLEGDRLRGAVDAAGTT